MACNATASPFQYLRITPTCGNPWIAAGNFVGTTNDSPAYGITGVTFGCSGITGLVPSKDPNTGCPRPNPTCGVNGLPVPSYLLNQCTIISWTNIGATAIPLVDSTVAVSVNLACPNTAGPLINYGLTPEGLVDAFGCCQPGATIALDQSCFSGSFPCNNVVLCPSGNFPTPSPPAVVPSVDGVMQFITQICGSATNVAQSSSGSSPYGVYNFLIKPPTFPISIDSVNFNNNPSCFTPSNPFANFFQSNVNPIKGYGNYNPLQFTIGACFNGLQPQGPCSQLVTLIYIGALCQTPTCVDLPVGGIPIDNKNSTECPATVSTTAYFYPYYYANIKFSVTDASGNPRRCKSKYGANCFLSVAPYSPLDAAQFCVYFGQTRSCGGLNQIIVNNVVDLTCLLYGGTVYVITAAKTLYSLL